GGVRAGAGGGYGGGSKRPVSGFQVGANAPPGLRRGWYSSAARVSRAALQGLRAVLRKTPIEKTRIESSSWWYTSRWLIKVTSFCESVRPQPLLVLFRSLELVATAATAAKMYLAWLK
ncbi:unnamed protein product, partial [Ectocarpus sp. 12 AP-2014]